MGLAVLQVLQLDVIEQGKQIPLDRYSPNEHERQTDGFVVTQVTHPLSQYAKTGRPSKFAKTAPAELLKGETRDIQEDDDVQIAQ